MLTFKEYQTEAAKTAIYSSEYRIIYPALGLAGEAGEVLGKISKVLRDNDGQITDEIRTDLQKELGDCFWMLAALCTDLGLEMEDTAQVNIEKLRSRAERGTLRGSGDSR